MDVAGDAQTLAAALNHSAFNFAYAHACDHGRNGYDAIGEDAYRALVQESDWAELSARLSV